MTSSEKKPAAAPSRPTLIQRLSAIEQEIRAVEKNGTNAHNNYKYTKADDVVAAVKTLMGKHGVYHLPLAEQLISRALNGKNFHSVIEARALLVNVDDPADKIEVTYISAAADTLDKDIFKAKTGGQKYLYNQLFKISTGLPDPEQDGAHEGGDEPTTSPATAAELAGASSPRRRVQPEEDDL
jgi:hypothetical protein